MLSPQQLVTYLTDQMDEWAGVPGKRQVAPILFCGELSETTRQVLTEHMQGKSIFIDSLQAVRRASTLASLAIRRLYEGRIEDPMLLEPLYVRRPSITKSARKQPLLGRKSTQVSDPDQTEREEGALRH
jgi:tRNA threonylcarbamoyladenosine biosynthesis protein TsaB